MQTKSQFTGLLMTAAAVLSLAGLCARADMKQGTATVSSFTGTVTYEDAAGHSYPVRVGTVLKEGDLVRTAAGSIVDLVLPENGTVIGLTEGSVLKIDRLGYEDTSLGRVMDTRLDLQAGGFLASVDKLSAGSRYEVNTPHGVASVKGTTFYIHVQSGAIYVLSGTVVLTLHMAPAAFPGVGVWDGTFVTKFVTIAAGQTFQLNLFRGVISTDTNGGYPVDPSNAVAITLPWVIRNQLPPTTVLDRWVTLGKAIKFGPTASPVGYAFESWASSYWVTPSTKRIRAVPIGAPIVISASP
ncbi:MAG: FecR domain-containing protein [Verrucomicrobia bacterium]|nr:FecR domain-containing protein [Verrucomicrobiota bacterium]